MPEFKDALKLNKLLDAEDVRLNYTSLDDYFRSPIIPDNQKVLIALLVLKKRFKAFTLSNSFIAEFLNRKGIYAPIYEDVEDIDMNTGEMVKTSKFVKNEVIFTRTKEVDGNATEEKLYTPTGVSDAIKKWEREGVIMCKYDYEFNKKMDKPFKFSTTRTIRFNIEALKPLLASFKEVPSIYSELPARSRRRKLIRSRPFSILDEIKKAFNELAEEVKKRYHDAEGIFLNYCFKCSSKYFNIKLSHKPNASLNEMERYLISQNQALNQVLDTGQLSYHPSIKTTEKGAKINNIIKKAFDSMVKKSI